MSEESQVGVTYTAVRKRRSRRHQRNRRIQRALLICACVAFTFACSAIALHYLSPALFHSARNSEPDRKTAEAGRNLFLASQQEALRDMDGRTIYKYSVVPGGVRDVRELK